MDTISVGIREFRAGLTEYIDQRKPIAVTRHGVTVGVFVPTPRPSPGDVQALREASAKLQAVLSLGDDEVEATVADFDTLRKSARKAARAPRRG
jgi:antitoxin (DNA-binding transcriptional repressor) of toxin-antitoxin stability system